VSLSILGFSAYENKKLNEQIAKSAMADSSSAHPNADIFMYILNNLNAEDATKLLESVKVSESVKGPALKALAEIIALESKDTRRYGAPAWGRLGLQLSAKREELKKALIEIDSADSGALSVKNAELLRKLFIRDSSGRVSNKTLFEVFTKHDLRRDRLAGKEGFISRHPLLLEIAVSLGDFGSFIGIIARNILSSRGKLRQMPAVPNQAMPAQAAQTGKFTFTPAQIDVLKGVVKELLEAEPDTARFGKQIEFAQYLGVGDAAIELGTGVGKTIGGAIGMLAKMLYLAEQGRTDELIIFTSQNHKLIDEARDVQLKFFNNPAIRKILEDNGIIEAGQKIRIGHVVEGQDYGYIYEAVLDKDGKIQVKERQAPKSEVYRDSLIVTGAIEGFAWDKLADERVVDAKLRTIMQRPVHMFMDEIQSAADSSMFVVSSGAKEGAAKQIRAQELARKYALTLNPDESKGYINRGTSIALPDAHGFIYDCQEFKDAFKETGVSREDWALMVTNALNAMHTYKRGADYIVRYVDMPGENGETIRQPQVVILNKGTSEEQGSVKWSNMLHAAVEIELHERDGEEFHGRYSLETKIANSMTLNDFKNFCASFQGFSGTVDEDEMADIGLKKVKVELEGAAGAKPVMIGSEIYESRIAKERAAAKRTLKRFFGDFKKGYSIFLKVSNVAEINIYMAEILAAIERNEENLPGVPRLSKRARDAIDAYAKAADALETAVIEGQTGEKTVAQLAAERAKKAAEIIAVISAEKATVGDKEAFALFATAGSSKEEASSLKALESTPMIGITTRIASTGTNIIPNKTTVKGLHEINTEFDMTAKAEKQAADRAGRDGSAGSYELIISQDDILDRLSADEADQYRQSVAALAGRKHKTFTDETERKARAAKIAGEGAPQEIIDILEESLQSGDNIYNGSALTGEEGFNAIAAVGNSALELFAAVRDRLETQNRSAKANERDASARLQEQKAKFARVLDNFTDDENGTWLEKLGVNLTEEDIIAIGSRFTKARASKAAKKEAGLKALDELRAKAAASINDTLSDLIDRSSGSSRFIDGSFGSSFTSQLKSAFETPDSLKVRALLGLFDGAAVR
ncbi:MAG: hypothetical protein FWC57_05640, partial [Endomicrobia bacterium]|nr:hypothetical protein [Endomicrobiia bacterium]